MKKVSCIIPTYNSAKTIAETIMSLKNQTYTNIEIIVADDCSTDGTLKAVWYTLQSKPHREFKILTNDWNTGGPNNGKNKALEVATGDYITFCDHDDQWHPDRIRLQVEQMERTGCLIGTTGRKNIDIRTGEEQVFIGKKEVFEANEAFMATIAPDYKKQTAYHILADIMIDKSLSHYRFENLYGVSEFSWMMSVFHNRRTCEVHLPLSIRIITGDNFSLSNVYRKKDFICKRQMYIMWEEQYPKEIKRCRWKYEGSEGRYNYLQGNYPQARKHFLRSKPTLKNIAYYVSSFVCPEFVKTHFHIFG